MMMKMAAVSSITLLLLCCSAVFTFADSRDECDYYSTTSESITLPLHHSLKKGQDLRWIHNKTVIFYGKSNGVVNVKKAEVSENGSLKLSNLDKSKAGSYTPEVYVEGKVYRSLTSTKLCILDRVPVPEVKFQCLSSSVNFTCSIEQPTKDLKFEWLQSNKVLKNITGQTLLEKTAKEVEKDLVSCKVSNRASSMVSLPVKQNCTAEVAVLQIFEIVIWIVVGCGGGIVLVLIVVVIVCCIRIRKKKRMQVKADEEELRLKWTNPDRHNHHHHHHHHQQQPAGRKGPHQPRSKQQVRQQRRRDRQQPSGNPQPSSRRPVQGSRPVNKDNEQLPPLPKPRKKAPPTPTHQKSIGV